MPTRTQVLIPIAIAAIIIGVVGMLTLPSDVKLESVEFPRGTIILDDNIPYKKFIHNSEEVFSFELFNSNTWELNMENYNNTYLIDSYNNKTIKITFL